MTYPSMPASGWPAAPGAPSRRSPSRRWLVAGVLVVVPLLLVALVFVYTTRVVLRCEPGAVPSTVRTGDVVSQFAGNGGRTGTFGSTGVAPGAAERWCARAAAEIATIMVAGDSVVVDDVSETASIFDLRTGELRWTAEVIVDAVSPDLVYVEDRRDEGGANVVEVQALDLASGSVRWRHRATGTGGRAVLAADVLFIEQTDADTDRTAVVALDAATGAVRWEHPSEGTAGTSLAADGRSLAVTVDDGEPRDPAADGHVMVLDAATGAERWRVDHAGYNPFVIVDQRGILVLDFSGKVLRSFDPTSGAAQWTRTFAGGCAVGPSFVATADIAVVSAGSCGLSGVDRSTGAVSWTVDDDGLTSLVGGNVQVQGGDGLDGDTLRTRDPRTGREAAPEVQLPFAADSTLIVADGLAFAPMRDQLFAVG